MQPTNYHHTVNQPDAARKCEYYARLREIADAAKRADYVGPSVPLDPHS